MLDQSPQDRYSAEDLARDIALLELSDIFDASEYRARAGLGGDANAAEHYLLTGWRLGLEPYCGFDGSLFYPYFRSVGLGGPPAITYLGLHAAGWPTYTAQDQAQAEAAVIRSSQLFDEARYAAQLGNPELDPVLHYLLVGEQMGLAPSDAFDPVYYRRRYPDVDQVRMSPLYHYVTAGKSEGRRPVSVAACLRFDTSRLDPERDTLLMVMHQASRTGAPILAYNIAMRLRERFNIVGLLLAGGNLAVDFERCCAAIVGPMAHSDWHPVEAEYLVKRLLDTYRIKYAIANTIDSRIMFKPLACALVPLVSLIHEFATYVRPQGEMGRALEWVTQIVFSADSVAASALSDYPNLENRVLHVLPQGQSAVPPGNQPTTHEQKATLRAAIRPPGKEDAFVVLGCGTIFLRKGVDLFLACAAAVARLAPRRAVRFVWIGARLPREHDNDYSVYLDEQIARSGLLDTVVILDEVADLEPAYTSSDLFFLSSRLDPLPNVAIDSALCGLPVICFENAGGMADLLGNNETTRGSVVPYLDVNAAAQIIARLADDPQACTELGEMTRRLGEKAFDMERYVERIDELGDEAVRLMEQRGKDLATIAADPMFDTLNFLGADSGNITRDQAIRLFLARSAALGIGRRPTSNFYYRRPCPGFHPQIYAYERFDAKALASINPLADFIRAGKPRGPWQHEVITSSAIKAHEAPERRLRVALHGHFYYTELLVDFLGKLEANCSPCDLFLSTSDDSRADLLRETARGYDRGTVTIRVVPNRGRDIGPFLSAFADELTTGYDLIGHVHSKRSLFMADMALGESWREFLWQNLVGDFHPMLDTIVGRFADDKELGIVFPDDPHLSDWDFNLDIAETLAGRMGITRPLPPFFNFPIGTMFWARPQALAPLFGLRLQWDDYPEEPIGIDGTMLHAIERLLPFVAAQAGFRYATTHVPGLTW